jgi:cytochrome c oxidase assembly protein subunit 15
MDSFERRLRLLRGMAWTGAVLLLMTITLSATMRLAQAGLGCSDWPACYAQGLRAAQSGASLASSDGIALARLAHRIVASATLVLILVMVMTALGTKLLPRRPAALALTLLFIAVALAALGIVTPGARLPIVAIGNLLGGFVMLALCVRLAHSARAPASSSAASEARLGASGLAALALLCAQLAGGALVSASYAGLSCRGLADCTSAAAASGWDGSALNPWREPVFAFSALPIHREGAFALWLHQVGAIVVLPWLVWAGWTAWRRGRRRGGATLLALLAAQAALGPAIVALGLPLTGVLLHNLQAALLLAALARLV